MKRNRNTPNKSDKRKKQFYKILFTGLSLLVLFIIVYLPATEWVNYNLLHRPLYFFFSDLFYCAYIIEMLKFAFILVFLIGISYGGILELIDKKKSKFKKLCMLFVIPLSSFFGYLIAEQNISEMKFIMKDQYLVEEIPLSRYRRYITHGRMTKSAHYKIYTYDLKGEYSQRDIQRAETHLSIYKDLDLNIYQYRDLEKIKENYLDKGTSAEDVILKIYYLPNTRQVLQYEILDK